MYVQFTSCTQGEVICYLLNGLMQEETYVRLRKKVLISGGGVIYNLHKQEIICERHLAVEVNIGHPHYKRGISFWEN